MKKLVLLLLVNLVAGNVFSEFWLSARISNNNFKVGSFECTAVGFFPESDECSQVYYYCDEELIAYPLECPGTAVFDPVIEQCTDFDRACCNPSVTCTSVAQSTTTASFICPEENEFYPIADECSQYYYYCEFVGEPPYLLLCPGSAVYDALQGMCTDLETACCNPAVVCETTTVVTNGTTGETQKMDTSTSSTTEMSLSTEMTSTTSTSTETSSTTSTSTEMSSTTSTSTETSSTTSTTTEMTTTTTRTTGTPANFTCPTPNGNYPYEGDCTKFWACSNGFPNLMYCPEPLVFNPSKNVCDYVQNVPECQ